MSGFPQRLGGSSDARPRPKRHDRNMPRLFVMVSSLKPETARRAVLASPLEIDVAVISPSEEARKTAAYALGGRWVFTVEEPLLASRSFAESGADVLARLAQAMRGLDAYDARASLVVLDGLDILGADVFTLDEEGLLRWSDDLDRLLPAP